MIWKMKLNKFIGVFLIFLSLLPAFSFANDDAKTTFKKGNSLYAQGNYKEALAVYKQVNDDGYQSASLFFNMGNANYKLGDIASAILYYEKAHKIAPYDDDINFNIKFANQKTSDKIDETPEFFLSSWLKRTLLGFSINILSILNVVFMFLASVILIIYLFANTIKLKKTSFFVSISLFIVSFISIAISIKQTNYLASHRQAIIFNSAVSVKNAPIESSGTLLILHDGTKVNIIDNQNGWMKIMLANGNQGWVKVNDIKEI